MNIVGWTLMKVFRVDFLTAWRYELWLHFLPYRIVCFFLKHSWGEPNETVTVGPLHVPPDQRQYHVLGYSRSCERCCLQMKVEMTMALEAEIVARARKEDWEEWNDPQIREALLSLAP